MFDKIVPFRALNKNNCNLAWNLLSGDLPNIKVLDCWEYEREYKILIHLQVDSSEYTQLFWFGFHR